jgi:hypothetical protein
LTIWDFRLPLGRGRPVEFRTSLGGIVNSKIVLAGVAVLASLSMGSTSVGIAPADDGPASEPSESAVGALESYAAQSDDEVALDEATNLEIDVAGDHTSSLTIGGQDSVVSVGLPETDPVAEDVADGSLHVASMDQGDTVLAIEAVASPDEEVFATGARVLVSIGNADSPSEYVFDVELPQDHVLVPTPEGGLQGENPDTREVSVVIPAPWAVDAEGNDVPTHYEVAGNTVTQRVQFNENSSFPIVADPVWFVPLIIAGGRVIGSVAVRAATKSAATARAASIAAARIVRTVAGKVPRATVRRCGLGAAVGGATTGSTAITVKKRADGKYHVSVNGWNGIVAAGVGGCLAANIR